MSEVTTQTALTTYGEGGVAGSAVSKFGEPPSSTKKVNGGRTIWKDPVLGEPISRVGEHSGLR